MGDAVTPASGREGISRSRKLSCQGSVGIAPLVNLASRPQTDCLFRLNESHAGTYAKPEAIAVLGLDWIGQGFVKIVGALRCLITPTILPVRSRGTNYLNYRAIWIK